MKTSCCLCTPTLKRRPIKMNKTATTIHINLSIVVLFVSALLALTLIPSKQAEALAIDSVSQVDFVYPNALVIHDLYSPAPVQITNNTTAINVSRTTKDLVDRSYLGVWGFHDLIYNDLNYNKDYTYYAMVTSRCETAATIEFPQLTTIGDRGSITASYPRVGRYGGRALGANVTYTVTYDPIKWSDQFGGTATSTVPYPFLQLSDSLFNGVRQINSRDVEVHVEFFDSNTNARVDVKNSWFSVSSLNPGITPVTYPGYITGSEQVKVKEADTHKIEYLTDGMIKVHQDGTNAIAYSDINSPAASGWVDDLNHDTFTRATAVMYQEDSFDFTIRGNNIIAPGVSPNYAVWWSLASMGLSNQEVEDPIKTVDKPEANPGDILNYKVSQTVNDLGVNGVVRYRSMSMIDTLPSQVDYVAGSAKLFKVRTNGTTTEVSASAGSFSYSASSKKLSYTFSPSYLASMELRGESYVMEFQAKLNSDLSNLVTNTSETLINDHSFKSNEVSTLVNKPELKIEKAVNSYEQQVGDYASYTIKISNTEQGTYAKDVLIRDVGLPSNVALEHSSIAISGVPSPVNIDVVESNGDITHNKSVPNNHVISPSGNGFRITLDYLPSGHEITVTYKALVKPNVAGNEVANIARINASNADPKQDTKYIWANSASLDFIKDADRYEYQVGDKVSYSLCLRNTKAGTIAKDISIDESSLPDNLKIDMSSFQVSGQSNTISYPSAHSTQTSLPNNTHIQNTPTGFVWSVDYLPFGDSYTISFDAIAEKSANGHEVINRAKASTLNPVSGHPNPIEASESVWINTPDLVPIKTSNDTAHKVGDTITYDIDITNEQAGTLARNVVIKDQFATQGIKIDHSSIVVSDSKGNLVTNLCTIKQNVNVDGFTITTPFSLVSLDNYSIYDKTLIPQNTQNPLGITEETLLHIEFKAQIVSDDLAGKEIINNVEVSSDEGLGGKDEDKASVNGPVLRINKTVDKGIVCVGDSATYTLEVTQIREGLIAKNVVIEDGFQTDEAQIIAETIKVYDEMWNDMGAKCSHTETGDTLINTNRDLSDSEKIYVEYDAEVVSAPVSDPQLINTASAYADNADKVIDKKAIGVTKATTEVDVVKSAQPESGSSVSAQEELSYILTVSNTGSTDAHDIAVYDEIPANTSFVSVEDICGATYFEDTNAIGWNIEVLKPQESIELSFTVVVNDDILEGGIIENYATYLPETPEIPKQPLPNETNGTEHPVIDSDVEVIKSADPESGSAVGAEGEITYTLNLTNYGGSSACDIAIYDAIPANTSFVSVEDVHGATYFEEQDGIGWNVSVLAPGKSTTLSFIVKVNKDVEDGADIENYATWAPNTPDIPEKPLPDNETNMVEHTTYIPEVLKTQEVPEISDTSEVSETPEEGKASGKKSGYDKTGNPFGGALWITIASLSAITVAGLSYAGYQTRRMYVEKQKKKALLDKIARS